MQFSYELKNPNDTDTLLIKEFPKEWTRKPKYVMNTKPNI